MDPWRSQYSAEVEKFQGDSPATISWPIFSFANEKPLTMRRLCIMKSCRSLAPPVSRLKPRSTSLYSDPDHRRYPGSLNRIQQIRFPAKKRALLGERVRGSVAIPREGSLRAMHLDESVHSWPISPLISREPRTCTPPPRVLFPPWPLETGSNASHKSDRRRASSVLVEHGGTTGIQATVT